MSEILNMTRSRKAGSGSCIEVFSLADIEPIGEVNISFHLFSWISGENSRQAQAIPFAFRSCIVSCEQWQT